MFLVLAVVAILSALAVIFNRNVVHSALSLLLHFCTLAILYFSLNAQFLGIAQVLVYAGAIVVLFLFVVMLVGADLGEPVKSWLSGQNIFLGILALILLTVIGTAVFEYTIQGESSTFTPQLNEEFGQTEAIAGVLFTQYTLPFQLVAVLLSVGVVGVVWLARYQQRQNFREVVAVLDAGWPAETERVGVDKQRVNWLQRQQVFDFDWVEIVNATNKDVESFVVQIGDDDDEWRQSRYPQMQCVISPQCSLSENTLRILKNTFGEVRVGQPQRVA